MWTVDHHGESTAQPATVYALLADTARWAEWNDGVRSIELDGPFAAGTTATMVLPDGTSLPFRLAWVDPARGFEDVTEVPDAGVVVRVAPTCSNRAPAAAPASRTGAPSRARTRWAPRSARPSAATSPT
jgi:hypothetical protein